MRKAETDVEDTTIRIDVEKKVKIFLDDSYQVSVVTTRLLVDEKK